MRQLSIFLLCLSLLLFQSHFATSQDFALKAKYAVLMDYGTGTILFAKNENEKVVPSSMSKIMTTYLAFKYLSQGKIKLDDEFIVSEKAWKMGGSKMFLHVGDKVKVDDLLKGTIVQSGNDACIVIAEGIFGTEELFVEQMNIQAKELGMMNSHFTNATGWPEPNHLMTVYDLAILSKRLIQDFPEYYDYHSLTEFTYNSIKQGNRNVLLGKNGVDGIKTGHTEEGGYGIVASALNKEGTRLIAVLNGLSSMNERKEEAENLLNYGFINFSTKHFYKKGDIIQNVNVKYGIEDILAITTLEDVVAVVPRTYSEKDLDIQIHTNSLEAPILEGQEVGWLIVHDLKKKEEIKRYNLVASKAIEESGIFKRLMQWIKYSISLFV